MKIIEIKVHNDSFIKVLSGRDLMQTQRSVRKVLH